MISPTLWRRCNFFTQMDYLLVMTSEPYNAGGAPEYPGFPKALRRREDCPFRFMRTARSRKRCLALCKAGAQAACWAGWSSVRGTGLTLGRLQPK
jgi:hypothetical protein